jgi:O-antigen/teichoic acid export membrane protein
MDRTILNLFTSALAWGWPVLLAFFVTPVLVRGMGNDSYGIRGLTTALVGYFAVMDLGLNGAVTKFLAEYVAKDDKVLIKQLLGTTLLTYVVVGLTGGIIIWCLAEWISNSVFSVPIYLRLESIWAFRITGIGFFFSMIIWWGSAIPAGVQRFDVFNFISIAFGTVTSLGSLVAIWLGWGLLGVIGANVVANILAAGGYFVAANWLLPDIKIKPSFDLKMFKKTSLFGIHMVLFRIFILFFNQLDRLLIGALLSPAILTFYIVPQQLSIIVHQVNAKMMQIIFPMASEYTALNKSDNIKRLFSRGMNLSFFIATGIALPLIVLARPLLTYWMSPEIASKSTLVLQIMTIMYLMMSLTALPSGLLVGIGKPKMISIFAAVLGICASVSYWVFINLWGIIGVAVASALCISIYLALHLFFSRRFAGISLSGFAYNIIRPSLIALILGLLTVQFALTKIRSLLDVLMVSLLLIFSYGLGSWFFGVFSSEEKHDLLSFYKDFSLKFSNFLQ